MLGHEMRGRKIEKEEREPIKLVVHHSAHAYEDLRLSHHQSWQRKQSLHSTSANTRSGRRTVYYCDQIHHIQGKM